MSLLSQYHFKGRQEQAVTDPNPAIAVTAGAGSGKTLALVGRYLHLLEQGYPLRSILAVTFTEKAAREMRGRIRKALAHTSSDELAAKHTKANHDVLSAQNRYGGFNIDSARIGTIHSLCAEILRTHPAEAGLDPAFGMLEEGLSAALQAEAIDAALAWAVSDPGAAALFGDFKEGDLRKILGTLLSRRLDVSPLPILGEGIRGEGCFRIFPFELPCRQPRLFLPGQMPWQTSPSAAPPCRMTSSNWPASPCSPVGMKSNRSALPGTGMLSSPT